MLYRTTLVTLMVNKVAFGSGKSTHALCCGFETRTRGFSKFLFVKSSLRLKQLFFAYVDTKLASSMIKKKVTDYFTKDPV